MASAAKRLFSIPELLEHILLQLDNDALGNVNIATSNQLFSLLRISRNFQSTIKASTKLKVKMGLGYLLSTSTNSTGHATTASPYLQNTYLQGGGLTPGWQLEGGTNYGGDEFRLKFHIYMTSQAWKLQPTAHLASADGNRFGAKRHTWRRIKATTLPCSTRITLRVHFTMPDGNMYTETSDWDSATLGDVADMLDAVSTRTFAEHCAILTRDKAPCVEWNYRRAESFLRWKWLWYVLGFKFASFIERDEENAMENVLWYGGAVMQLLLCAWWILDICLALMARHLSGV